MTAPTDAAIEVADQPTDSGEIRVRLPVVVIEGLDTTDGRFLAPGSLTHRALPISLLACPASAHGGQEPEAAQVIGRVDVLTRHPGPEVMSPRTGEPFPEGTFVWSGEGAIDASHPIADLVRRRFLRGVSVDLAGMDVELIGEDEALANTENPRRRMIAHAAEIGGVTLVPLAAFSDAYIELADDVVPRPGDPVPVALVPEGVTASAAWRSAEVGDYPTLTVAGEGERIDIVSVPDDAAEQLAEFIAAGEGEQRDASQLASAIIAWIGGNWAPAVDEEDPESIAEIVAAANDPQVFSGHDLIFYERRSTPKVVSRGAKAPEVPDSYGRVVSRRKATAEEEATIARGDWVRVDSSGKKPGDAGYDKSKIRPGLAAADNAPSYETDASSDSGGPQLWHNDKDASGDMGLPDAPQPCEMGDHPAVRSLLFDDGARYLATCGEHDAEVRALIEQNGATVTGVVEIEQPDDPTQSAEEISSRTADRA